MRSARGETDSDAFQRMRFWTPYLALLILFGIDEGTGISSAWARLGSGPSISGKPAEVFGHLLDQGPDHRAARAVRRLLGAGLSPDVAHDVAVERFQHWTKRTPASYQLGTVGAPAVPLLIRLLGHDKERVRQQAALSLGDIGLAAEPAIPALETVAHRTPFDSSSHAARNALGDVAPEGLKGWLWKLWYEIPLLALIMIVLELLELGLLYPKFFRRKETAGDPVAVPPAGVALGAGLLGIAMLAFGAVDLLGERFTVEADVWLLALGIWFTGASLLTIRLRRRELIPRA